MLTSMKEHVETINNKEHVENTMMLEKNETLPPTSVQSVYFAKQV